MDNNEDGVDCGGYNCLPCEFNCSGNGNFREYISKDKITNTTIVKDYIKAGDLKLTGDIVNISKNNGQLIMKAGNYISFEPGFDVNIGSHLTASIGDCDYRDICDLQYYPNVFTPNCDGVNDWLGFWVNGATKYEFWVIGQKIKGGASLEVKYHGIGPVNGNYVRVWDGKTLNKDKKLHSNHLYYLIRFFNSNLGTMKGDPEPNDAKASDFRYLYIASEVNQPCSDDGGWSASYKANGNDETYLNNYLNENFDLITIFPNPTYHTVTIESKIEILSYNIFDSNMKCVLCNQSYINSIDFSRFAPGTYFLQFILEGDVITKKVTKL
jgi:hypothetical protein